MTRDKKDRGDPLNVDDATRSKSVSPPVDDTDWLKTAAIIFVSIGHFGYFFVEDARWWSVVGRLAAPTFFFLIGYARSRTVPLNWIWLGIILTVLESWNADWAWVAPNILLSFAFIRLARPHVERLVERYGWAAFVVLVCGLLAVLPLAAKCFDYGSEGWLWALFGLCQRRYVDGRAAAQLAGASTPGSASHHVRDGDSAPQCEADPARRMRSSPLLYSSGRNKRNSRFLRFLSRSSCWSSSLYQFACACFGADRAACNRRRARRGLCASSADALC